MWHLKALKEVNGTLAFVFSALLMGDGMGGYKKRRGSEQRARAVCVVCSRRSRDGGNKWLAIISLP